TTDPGSGTETWSGQYSFTTVGSVVDSMNVAVVADFNNGLGESLALQSALDARPDLLAVIGDLDHRNPGADGNGKLYPPEDAPQVLATMRKMHRDSRDPATPLGRNFWSGLVGNPD